MIINVDAKALEWCVGSWLANDSMALYEIITGLDMHSDNQQKFGLPSRLISKKFIFRLIFGGSAYSYVHDPDFAEVSTKPKYWENVIEQFHDKYKGWSRWWIHLMQTAISSGKVISPLGRVWEYEPVKNWKGEAVWPETTIKNYIVQGTSADLMCLTRVEVMKEFRRQKIKGELITTVHDSIVADVENQETERMCILFEDVFAKIPQILQERFGVAYNLPFRCEVSYGPTMGNLVEFNRGNYANSD